MWRGMARMRWSMMLLVVAGVKASLLDNTTRGYTDPPCQGDRHVIVHLFEWPWDDIADECESFLGPKVLSLLITR